MALIKPKMAIVSLSILLFLTYTSKAEDRNLSLSLEIDHQMYIKSSNINRLAIGNPEIIGVSSINQGKGLLIAGKKLGSTDIIIWEQNRVRKINIVVVENSESREEKKNQELISILSHLGVHDPVIRKIGKQKIVTGSGNKEAVEKTGKLLSKFGDVINGIKVDLRKDKEIVFELKFMEISKGSLKSIGVDWPDNTEVRVDLRKEDSHSATFNTSFSVNFKTMLSEGKARILANPILTCKEGESASFLAGGEIPIVIVSQYQQSVIWKKYGIMLDLENRRGPEGMIVTKVQAEVSTLDHSNGSTDIPGILTRRVNTSFSLVPGKTIILSGLVKNDVIKDIKKVPLIGQIPIIGELFKSRNFRNNISELIITITPIFTDKFNGKSLTNRFLKKYKDMNDEMKFHLYD